MGLIVSKATKSLIVPRGGAVDNLFPNAPALDLPGGRHAVLPHDTRTYLLLHRLGLQVPNPILTHYSWAGGKPFSVQRATCAMLTTFPRAYVLNDMGTGKTRSALWAWDYLYDQGLAGKLLVVAPLSTLHFVWAREIFATLPHRKVQVLHGSKDKRLQRLGDTSADIYVINHDGLKVIQDELDARHDIKTLVLDELAVYRNESTRSKLMRKFARRFDFVWGLSGRPMPNEPTDVWSQCMIVTPNSVPKRRSHARDMLMLRINQFKWVPKDGSVEKAFSMMQPSVRFVLDDIVELPDVVYRDVDVQLTPEQARTYSLLAREFHAMVATKEITAANAAVAMGKLLQVACGWVYAGKHGSVSLDSAPRTQALLDLILSAAHKVIVFVPFRNAIDGIAEFLRKEAEANTQKGEEVAIDYAVVHGDVNPTERDRIFKLFQQTNEYRVLLAHPKCVAHGLTLTAADTAVWYCPTASLETYEQANARIIRFGQKHKQQVLHLRATPVEKRMYALLRGRKKVQDQLLAMFAEATGTTTGD